jgi:hypothetical protein
MKVIAELDGLSLDDNVEIFVRKKQFTDLPPYDCIGGNMVYKTKKLGFQNLYDVLQGQSKQALWVWHEFLKRRDRSTNIAVYKPITSSDQQRLIIAYKSLAKADLVLRTRRQHYLLNPLAVLPEKEYFQQVSDLWLATKEHNKG